MNINVTPFYNTLFVCSVWLEQSSDQVEANINFEQSSNNDKNKHVTEIKFFIVIRLVETLKEATIID